ncbi:MAG: transcriptional repressor [Deltaproteobacteria bacterium]|nr:transcriptional repressor [Deltaproteobacteria bacterium]
MEETNTLMDRLYGYLHKKGLKQTKQRDLIARTFFSLNTHLKIEELLVEVQKKDPKVGYVTVYRALKLLKESGLAHQRHFGEGQSLFEPAGGGHHDHMICIKCGNITEFEDEVIERRQEEVAKKIGFKIVSHRHEIYGACPKCQEE